MNIDIVIVAIYLIATLVVGVWRGRGIRSLKEYAVSDRKYTVPVLVATIAATWYGGNSSIGVAEKVYSFGIVFVFLNCLIAISKLFIGYCIAPKIKFFSNAISVGDIMDDMFGLKAKYLTVLAGALFSMGFIGAQIAGLGYTLHYFFSIPTTYGILVGAGIVVIYSAFGGIKSVAATDVLQFFCIIVIIPLMATIIVQKAGGFNNIINTVAENKLTILPDNIPKIDFYYSFILLLIPFLDPTIIQRLLLSKKTSELTKSFKISSALDVAFYSLIGVITLGVITLNPNIQPGNAYFYVIENGLSAGMKGLAIVGLIAAIMSTADSYLNVVSVSLTNDVIKNLKTNITENSLLKIVKIVSILVGMSSILMAISFDSILDIVYFALDFWGPIIVMPLMLGILGFRASEKTFFIAAFVGLLVYFVIKINVSANIFGISYALLPSMFANAITYMSCRYFLDKTGIGTNDGNDNIKVKKKIN